MKRSITLFVEDILDSMNNITKYIENVTYDDFCDNQMIIDAVVRNLEIIGEAANNIPNDVRIEFSQIP